MEFKFTRKISIVALLFTIFILNCQQEEKKDNSLLIGALLFTQGTTGSVGGTATGTGTGTVTTDAPTPTITTFSPSSGIAGNTVTITGTNFSTTTSSNIVKFNTTTATVTAASATQLTVTVPTGATTGKISVEISGKSVTSTTDFTVKCSTCRIFITATTVAGNFGGITAAQTRCDNDSRKPATGTFKAFLLASNITTSATLSRGARYTRLDGTVIVNSAFSSSALVDTSFIANTDASNPITGTIGDSAWHGAVSTSTGASCSNWTSAASTNQGTYINASGPSNKDMLGGSHTDSGGTCATLRSIICVEE